MRATLLATMFGLATLVFAADEKPEKVNVPPKGFTALFNGKDLTNWQGVIPIVERNKLKKDSEAYEKRVTALDLPTAYWHELVRELSESNLSLPKSLRIVIVGGEKASSAALTAWRRLAAGRVRWVNTYGPTETSVIVSSFERKLSEEIPAVLPIGRPVRRSTSAKGSDTPCACSRSAVAMYAAISSLVRTGVGIQRHNSSSNPISANPAR